MLLKLAWRNLIRRPWQSGLTLFVVAACTAALTGCLFTLWSIENGAQGVLEQWGADVLVLPAQAEYTPEEVIFTGSPANIYMDAKVMAEIAKVDGVGALTAQFFSQTLNQSCCSLPEEYRLVGFDPHTDFLVKGLLAQGVGRDLTGEEVIVGGDIPAFLGDRVVILGQALSVAGYLKPLGGSIDRTIFVPIDIARQVAAKSPYLQELWQNAGNPQQLISAVLIKVNQGISPMEVAKRISRIQGVKAVTAGKLMQNLREQLTAFRSVIWTLALIICGITAASLCTRYSSLMFEKREEVGLLRILGARKPQVFHLVMTEVLVTGIAAWFLGSILGLGLFFYFKTVLDEFSSFPFLLPDLSQIVLALAAILVIMLLTSILAALWPARRSVNIDPIMSLAEGQLR